MDHAEHFDREVTNIFIHSLLNLSVGNNDLKIKGLDKLETKELDLMRRRGLRLEEGMIIPEYNVTTPVVKEITMQHRYQYKDVDNLQTVILFAGADEKSGSKPFSLRAVISGVQKFISQWTVLYQGSETIPRRAYIQSDVVLKQDGKLIFNIVISNVYGLADLETI